MRASWCAQKLSALQGKEAAAAAGGIVCKYSDTTLSHPPLFCPNAAI